MILISLSWIYIILTLIPFGVLATKWFSIKNNSFPEVSFLGLFLITFTASLWAFFGAIDIYFHLFLLISGGFLFLRYKTDVVAIYREMFLRIGRFWAEFTGTHWQCQRGLIPEAAPHSSPRECKGQGGWSPCRASGALNAAQPQSRVVSGPSRRIDGYQAHDVR
jgi:hypothetical protein